MKRLSLYQIRKHRREKLWKRMCLCWWHQFRVSSWQTNIRKFFFINFFALHYPQLFLCFPPKVYISRLSVEDLILFFVQFWRVPHFRVRPSPYMKHLTGLNSELIKDTITASLAKGKEENEISCNNFLALFVCADKKNKHSHYISLHKSTNSEECRWGWKRGEEDVLEDVWTTFNVWSSQLWQVSATDFSFHSATLKAEDEEN